MIFIGVTEEFEVLRFVEHQKTYYISSDFIRGRTLASYLNNNPDVKKEELWKILRGMSEVLARYHQSGGQPFYRYVNPYSFILDEQRNLYLLDLASDGNKNWIAFMQKRVLREYFLPPSDNFYQHASLQLDIYGLGKCMQYVLASATPSPSLTFTEELRLKKIIRNCLNNLETNSIHSIYEIQKTIPRIKTKKRRRIIMAALLGGLCLLIAVGAGVKLSADGRNSEKPSEPEDPVVEEPRVVEEQMIVETKEETIDQEVAIDQKTVDNPEERSGGQSFLDYMKQEGYKWVSNEKKAGAIFCLGEGYVYSLQDPEEIKELSEYVARAALAWGQEEEAVRLYKIYIENETRPEQKEEIFKRIIEILRSCGEKKTLMEVCKEGCDELPKSEAMKVEMVRAICMDTEQDQKEKEENINQILSGISSPESNKDLLQVFSENKISLEGGHACFKE